MGVRTQRQWTEVIATLMKRRGEDFTLLDLSKFVLDDLTHYGNNGRACRADDEATLANALLAYRNWGGKAGKAVS